MFALFRKNQSWLLPVVMGLVIISFVIYLNPASRNNNGNNSNTTDAGLGSVFGEPITRDQLINAQREGRLFFRLNRGQWIGNSKEEQDLLQEFAYERVLLLAELDHYHITPTPEAAARFTKQLVGVKPGDNVSSEQISDALKKLTAEGGLTMDDFYHFVQHQAAQEYLQALVGMSGKLITPQEAEIFYRRENEPVDTELVTFPSSNYLSMVKYTEADIQDFYTKREASYRLPDRVQFNYVEFNSSNYVTQAYKDLGSNLDEHISQTYQQQGSAAYKDEAGNELSPAAAKARIKQQNVEYAELAESAKEASAFLKEMTLGHDDQHPYSIGDISKVAAAKNMTVHTSEAIDPKNPPKSFGFTAQAQRYLYLMRDDDPDDKEHASIYASAPLQGSHGFYVAGLQHRYPSVVQPLVSVHDKVVADYKNEKALEMAHAAGKRFEENLDAGLKQGKSFDTMCSAQFVHPEVLSPFSLVSTSVPQIHEKQTFEEVQSISGRMHANQTSPFIPTADGGFVLYIKKQIPLETAALQHDMPLYLERMRERLQVAAFSAWFGKERQLHLTQPAAPGAAGASGT